MLLVISMQHCMLVLQGADTPVWRLMQDGVAFPLNLCPQITPSQRAVLPLGVHPGEVLAAVASPIVHIADLLFGVAAAAVPASGPAQEEVRPRPCGNLSAHTVALAHLCWPQTIAEPSTNTLTMHSRTCTQPQAPLEAGPAEAAAAAAPTTGGRSRTTDDIFNEFLSKVSEASPRAALKPDPRQPGPAAEETGDEEASEAQPFGQAPESSQAREVPSPQRDLEAMRAADDVSSVGSYGTEVLLTGTPRHGSQSVTSGMPRTRLGPHPQEELEPTDAESTAAGQQQEEEAGFAYGVVVDPVTGRTELVMRQEGAARGGPRAHAHHHHHHPHHHQPQQQQHPRRPTAPPFGSEEDDEEEEEVEGFGESMPSFAAMVADPRALPGASRPGYDPSLPGSSTWILPGQGMPQGMTSPRRTTGDRCVMAACTTGWASLHAAFLPALPSCWLCSATWMCVRFTYPHANHHLLCI